ncbi:hypothetical protein BSKO_10865 [Bryopsis sp. KO-2023]|nr:hypothetical protein BSKO_10865 [Bryopsis sp. KO-2023]
MQLAGRPFVVAVTTDLANQRSSPCGALRWSRSKHQPPPIHNKIGGNFGERKILPKRKAKQGRKWRVRSDDGPDFAERIFGGLFGKKALDDREPFGLKRLDADECPELYPATTTEFADPVEGDSEEIALFRPLLAKTQLQKEPLRLAFDADIHGWDPNVFHQLVDTFGASVVLGKTEGGALIGGYNPSGWIGIGESRDSIAAFLFTWPDGDSSKQAIKLPKVGGDSLAVIDKPAFGIQFGAEGLTIALERGQEKRVKSRLGSYYAKLPDGGRTLFSEKDDPKFCQLKSLKVFVAQGSGDEWQLDGIVWKTKRVE